MELEQVPDANRRLREWRVRLLIAAFVFMGVEVCALGIMVLGDVGFDKPGSLGLDSSALLWLVPVWGIAAFAAMVCAIMIHRWGLLALQLAAFLVPIFVLFSL